MSSLPLARAVGRAIQRYDLVKPGQTVVIGVSGGPDSLCLLHLLRRLASTLDLSLHVGHLNHGIRGEEAEADARFVTRIAGEWGLPVTVERVDVPDLARCNKLTVEEAARVARYSFLSRLAVRVGAPTIAVAHNADDQAETVLMHWLRGAGISGLRGMLPAIALSDYRLAGAQEGAPGSPLTLIRPLLEIPRVDIEDYCARHQLNPCIDSSNLDTSYFRNRLRHELIPFLETYNVNIRELLCRSATLMAADHDLLRQQMEIAWTTCVHDQDDRSVTFDLAAWQALHLSLKRATIREAVRRLRQALRDINFVHVQKALEIAARGETGEQATLPQELMLTVGYDSFIIADLDYKALPDLPLLEPGVTVPVALTGSTRLPSSAWVLKSELLTVPGDIRPEDLDRGRWHVFLDGLRVGESAQLRPRQAGDRFCPLGMEGMSKRVNEFMINEKIPAAWRDRVPLLVNDTGQILWVCGWRPDHRAAVSQATRQLLHLHFEREET